MQYLETVQEAGTDAADDVVAGTGGARSSTTSSSATAKIRAEDHRVVHDAYLAQVKTTAEVTEDWDYEKIVETIPADQAFQPVAGPPARCPLLTGGTQATHRRGVAVTTRRRPGPHTGEMSCCSSCSTAWSAAASTRCWPSDWPSSSACWVWSTSRTARSTCSAPSARTSCSTRWGSASGWLCCIVPLVLAFVGTLVERLPVRRLAALDPLYNFLLTFGITLLLQDLVTTAVRRAVQAATNRPSYCTGSVTSGCSSYPTYQVFVLVFSRSRVCVGVWLLLTRTRVGMDRPGRAPSGPSSPGRSASTSAAGSRRCSASASRWPVSPACSLRRCAPSTR